MGDEKNSQESQLEPRTYVLPPGYYPEWDEGDEISLLSYVNVLLRRRWLIVGISFVAVLAAYFFSKWQTPTYKANASFLVAEDKSTQVMTDTEGYLLAIKNPVDYFKKIAVSQKILDEMLQLEFADRETGEAARLAEIWNVEAESDEERTYKSREILKNRISLSNERNFPDLITLEVTASSPRLAADLANQLIVLLQQYDLDLKTENIQRRLDIIEPQLKSAEAKMEQAESSLENFLKRNRRASPEVEIEKGRLQQQVDLHRDIYNELRKQLELAQIARAEKTSTISPIDSAVPPRSPSSPRTRLNVALAGVVGLMLAVGLAFVIEFLFNFKEETEESREFKRTLQDIKSDFRRVFLLGRGTKKKQTDVSQDTVEYRQAHK